MNLFIKKGDIELTVEVGDKVALDKLAEFITTVHNTVFSKTEHCHCHKHGDSETFAEHYECEPDPPIRPSGEHEFTFRDRLPNSAIDVEKLNIQEAVLERALVRCPHCGQSHCLVVKDSGNFYLMRRGYSVNEFGIIAIREVNPLVLGEISCTDNTPKGELSYYEELQKVPLMDDVDFAVNNRTDIFCPVCHVSSPFIDWKLAYEDKNRYFEHEYICGACGGECVMDAQSEKDGNEIVVCTKCGAKWEKKNL